MNIPREQISPPAVGREKMFAGLLERKTCWGLSWRGRFLALALALAAGIGLVRSSYSFLAMNEPVPADLLVVEGWSPTYSMGQVAQEFLQGKYQRLLVVRAVLDLPNDYESGRYGGDYLANLLIQHGVPKDRLTTLYPLVVKKDRTYNSALAVKEWLAGQKITIKSLDVATLGPHARRSHLMYEKAFAGQAKIGIIALDNIDYDPAHWWRTSEGVREMLGESIAYMYARFLFHASL
jgi:hypothetical protein